MSFKQKYISMSESKVHPDPKKVIISDDAFAIADLLDQIRIKLNNKNG